MNLRTPTSDLHLTPARRVRRLLGCARGNITVLAAASLLALSGVAGAALTLAQVNSVSMELSDHADALALSAAMAVRDGGGEDAARRQADRVFAEVRRGVQGSGEASVEILPGPRADVVATLSREVPVVLGGLLGIDTVRLERSARAVASDGDPVCLHVLSDTQSEAFSRRGAASLEARNCVAQVNSASDEALDSRGAAGAVTTLRTLVRGSGQRVSSFKPAPEFGAPAVADPYAQMIDWPSASPCGSAGFRVRRSMLTLSPGVICGDLELGTGADVALLPGLHVITGSLTMGAGSRLSAEGATVVLVGDTSRIDIGSQSEAKFRAPTEGAWKDIAVAVKPQPSEYESSIQGGADLELTGVLYTPSQRLHLTGGGRLGEPTELLRMIVVNRLDLNGNGRVWLNGETSVTRASGGGRLVE